MVSSYFTLIKSKKGFTLLEVIISLTIIGIMTAILYNGMRLGLRARETGEDFEENNQRIRSIYYMIASQIKSAYPYYYPDQEDPEEKRLSFVGLPESIQFVTSAARLTPATIPEGLHETTIYLDEEYGEEGSSALMLREAPLRYPNIFESEAEPVVLAEEVANLSFSYYVVDEEGNGEWMDSYEGGTLSDSETPAKETSSGAEGEKASILSGTLPKAVAVSFAILIPREKGGEKSFEELKFPSTIIQINSGLEGAPILKESSEEEETQ